MTRTRLHSQWHHAFTNGYAIWSDISIVSFDFEIKGAMIIADFIYHFTSILHGLIRTHKWPTPNVSGFIAQLVGASHRYREVTGSNPVEVLTFSGFYTQLLKIVFITAMIIAHLATLSIDQSNRSPGFLNSQLTKTCLDSEDGFRTACRNVSRKQSFSGLQSPRSSFSRYLTRGFKPFPYF